MLNSISNISIGQSLPNVTGSFSTDYVIYVNGAVVPFSYTQVNAVGLGGGSFSNTIGTVTMDLSTHSETFKNGAYVRPDSRSSLFIVKY